LHEIFLSKTVGDHFSPGPIPPKKKMVTNNFGKRDFMQPTGRLNMHSWGGREWGAGGTGYFLFFFQCAIFSVFQELKSQKMENDF
jgi:hypothetical protein